MVHFVLQYTDFSKTFFIFTVSYFFTVHEQVKLHYDHKKGTAFHALIFIKIMNTQIFVGISCTEFLPNQMRNVEIGRNLIYDFK